MEAFWTNLPQGRFANEAEVEVRLVLPMLHALGYEQGDVASKYPVLFKQGRGVGRKPEADFVCFNGPSQNRNTSLLVVEAKAPGEPLPDGLEQGESYAANLRAPVLVLTDGLKLEIWQFQWTQESRKLLDIPVDDLYANRGIIEQLVSKQALIDYCESLKTPALAQLASDYSRYKNSELLRTAKYANSINRTLRPANLEERVQASPRLIEDYPRGAVIYAPSGYGKSTLANQLLRLALQDRTGRNTSMLPFLIPLPDLQADGTSIPEFMQQRISAHCPGVSLAAFVQILRLSGAAALCDGFDRISEPAQRKLNSEFANLLRDYPKIQIFIFSRGAARPSVDVPALELDRLSIEELCELEAAMLGPRACVVSMMPDSLREICRNALLAQQTFEYWKREKRLPQKIDYLFRSWIENLLNIGAVDHISGIDREAALTVLANATIASPIAVRDAIATLEQRGFGRDLFRDLIACDALRLSGSVAELQHEALADYLRAKSVASPPESALLKKLGSMNIPRESLYPALLMSQLNSRPLQAAMWKRLSEANLEVYLDALRYRYDLSGELSLLSTEELSRACIEDLLDGIDVPLDAFFPNLRNSVVELLVGTEAHELAGIGYLDESHTWLEYAFRPLSGPRVQIGNPYGAEGIWSRRGLNLERSGYRIDSGHLIGAVHLRDSLLKLSETLTLVGGEEWASERLIGRIRYLQRECGFEGKETDSLEDLERLLQPKPGEWVPTGGLGDEGFSISSLRDDIAMMRAAGRDHLDLWWLQGGWVVGDLMQEDAVIARVLDEYFRRMQRVQSEVVQRTFPALASEFSCLSVLPIRVRATVSRTAGPGGNRTMWQNFWPVSSWAEAGAEVTFAGEAPRISDGTEMYRRLKELNRPTVRYRIGGMSPVPSFDARHWASRIPGATPITHEVCSNIIDDLKHIFSALPSCETGMRS